MNNTKIFQSLSGIFFVVLMLSAAAFAQPEQERSEDRDKPAALLSNEISDDLDGTEQEYFYAFTAGPGKLSITFEVDAASTNAGAYLDLFGAKERAILSNVLVQGVDGGKERVVKTVTLTKRTDIVMRVKGIKYGSSGGNGIYKIKIDGPVNFAPVAAPQPNIQPVI